MRPAARGAEGSLVVFSAYEAHANFSDTSPYQRHYTDYKVLSTSGQLVQAVHNDPSNLFDGPATVKLPAGSYRVIAQSNGYGEVTVPVLVAGGQTTVVHLEGIAARPDLAWGPSGVHRLLISRAGLAALLARADAAFALRDAAPIEVPSGRPVGEAFFASGERFSLVHLCNHWTAQVLGAAGVPTTPVLDTLPAGMVLDLKLRAGI